MLGDVFKKSLPFCIYSISFQVKTMSFDFCSSVDFILLYFIVFFFQVCKYYLHSPYSKTKKKPVMGIVQNKTHWEQ